MTASPKTDSAAIRQIIRALRAGGYALHSVDNGEERILVSTEPKALEHILSVDDAMLWVARDGKRYAVRFVMGNEPYEVANNWSDSLSAVLDSVIFGWEDNS